MTLVSVTSRRSGKQQRTSPTQIWVNERQLPEFFKLSGPKILFRRNCRHEFDKICRHEVISFVFIFVTSVRLEILISDYI